MSQRFDYIIQKIRNAEFISEPFRHIEILNLFEDADLEEILTSPEISIARSSNDTELFSNLFEKNYRVIKFPGCIDNHEEYIEWHRNKNVTTITNTSCESFGIVLRLEESQSRVVQELQQFLSSEAFVTAISDKFSVNYSDCTYDAGIQKYLDGYEISPHPDIRRKALTYMVNINPSKNADQANHHTSYLNFHDDREYVKEFWKKYEEVERCWVPWSWCEINKQQTINNSLVIFAPSNDTMHAVKADYNHLDYQRTQLYGNLWYKQSPAIYASKWEDYEESSELGIQVFKERKTSLLAGLKNKVPRSIRNKYKSVIKKNNTNAERKF